MLYYLSNRLRTAASDIEEQCTRNVPPKIQDVLIHGLILDYLQSATKGVENVVGGSVLFCDRPDEAEPADARIWVDLYIKLLESQL